MFEHFVWKNKFKDFPNKNVTLKSRFLSETLE